MKYRKKPIEILAWRFTKENYEQGVPSWITDADRPIVFLKDRGELFCAINTLEGDMMANEGDWIIRGVAGELYPCKNDVFEKTYEDATQ